MTDKGYVGGESWQDGNFDVDESEVVEEGEEILHIPVVLLSVHHLLCCTIVLFPQILWLTSSGPQRH